MTALLPFCEKIMTRSYERSGNLSANGQEVSDFPLDDHEALGGSLEQILAKWNRVG
jgi:hypothetical protein